MTDHDHTDDDRLGDYVCVRCEAICNGSRVPTRRGLMDPGCYLMASNYGDLEQYTLAEAIEHSSSSNSADDNNREN